MGEIEKLKIEAAGWRFGDVAEFVGLPDWNNTIWDVENAVRRLVRQMLTDQDISQKVLAERIGSSQSNIAAIENGDPRYGVERRLRSGCYNGADCHGPQGRFGE